MAWSFHVMDEPKLMLPQVLGGNMIISELVCTYATTAACLKSCFPAVHDPNTHEMIESLGGEPTPGFFAFLCIFSGCKMERSRPMSGQILLTYKFWKRSIVLH